MAQDLTVNIKTTSDVPAAMDRAKTATVGFGKQVDNIQKKFSMAFKDVFLSFLGPLALLGVAMNYIGKLIDDNRKKHEDANQAAIDSTNALMSAEDIYWANKRNNEKKGKETLAEAKTTREDTTEQFINEDIRGKKIARRLLNKIPGEAIMGYEAKSLSKSPAVQAEVQAFIAEDIKNNPAAGANLKATNFKGPEGFSNVVGVGANPVMEAMNAQLEEQRKQTELLGQIANQGQGQSRDFTKDDPYMNGYNG
jgi:hypothetical protein